MPVTSNGLLREATAADWPAIIQCHRSLEEKLGTTMDLPAFDDRAILAWLVYERDGEVVQFGYWERAVEWCMAGDDPEALRAFIEQAPEVLDLARRAGCRFAHCFPPQEMKTNIGRHLKAAGFEESPHAAFRADLR